MAVVDTDKDLAELYRRGRLTANKIAGRPEKERLTYEPSTDNRTIEEWREKRPDDYFFRRLVLFPFFGGMKARTVEQYKARILDWLGDYRKVEKYDEDDIARMKDDPTMFRNMPKIRAAVTNASRFHSVIDEHGSFIDYIFEFNPKENDENLDRLMTDFQRRFKGYGPTLTMQFFMEAGIGLPLIKPDIHMMKTFYRIGLVDHDGDVWGTLQAAARVAQAAAVPVSWVDDFVDLGLKDFWWKGSDVCGEVPDCNRKKMPCEIRELCDEWVKRNPK